MSGDGDVWVLGLRWVIEMHPHLTTVDSILGYNFYMCLIHIQLIIYLISLPASFEGGYRDASSSTNSGQYARI